MLKDDYMKHFNYIVLLCPTFEYNKSYQEWKYLNNPNFIAIPLSHDKEDKMLGYVANLFMGTNTLRGQDVKNLRLFS